MSAAVHDDIHIDADKAAVLAVITDVGSYPEWQDEVQSAEVLDTDDQGRTTRARLTVDAKVFKTTYVLRYAYTDDAVSWELEEGDQLDELRGSYTLAEREGGTHVSYELTVQPKMKVPGFLRRQAAKRIADEALKGLRRRVEGGT